MTNDDDNAIAFTVEEVAKNCRLSRSRVYALIASGELRSIKIGRLRRIPASAVEEFVAGWGA